jgi:hypothetical protein
VFRAMPAENLLEAAKISLIFQGRVDIILGFRLGGVTEQAQITFSIILKEECHV